MEIEKYIHNSLLKIRVKPNCSKSEIKDYDENRNTLLVDIAAPPEKNKANIEVVKFFSKLLKKKVKIKKGLKNREKVLLIG
ncbi:MAG: YggU family protein [DPANN group archaeon]|nr:YggU family protein [DPANN group archaeon]